MVRVSCPSCQKPLSLDETKLPMREVSFPCPSCREKVTFDRRSLDSAQAAAAEALAVSEPPEGGDDDEFAEKAIVVGADAPQLRQALRSLGMQPVHFPEAIAARDFYLREYPRVVILAPAQVTPPPLDDATPLLSITPADRRRAFVILLADSIRTFDGNAAFLYGVNLVVASKDLASFGRIYREADAAHRRLYQHLIAV